MFNFFLIHKASNASNLDIATSITPSGLQGLTISLLVISILGFLIGALFLLANAPTVSLVQKIVFCLAITAASLALFCNNFHIFVAEDLTLTAIQQNDLLKQEYANTQQIYQDTQTRYSRLTEQKNNSYQSLIALILQNMKTLDGLQATYQNEFLDLTKTSDAVAVNYKNAQDLTHQAKDIIDNNTNEFKTIPIADCATALSALIQTKTAVNTVVNNIVDDFQWPFQIIKLFQNYTLFNTPINDQNFQAQDGVFSCLTNLSNASILTNWSNNASDNNMSTITNYIIGDISLNVSYNTTNSQIISGITYNTKNILYESIRIGSSGLVVPTMMTANFNNGVQTFLTTSSTFPCLGCDSKYDIQNGDIITTENVFFTNSGNQINGFSSSSQNQIGYPTLLGPLTSLTQTQTNIFMFSDKNQITIIEFFGFLPKNIIQIVFFSSTDQNNNVCNFMSIKKFVNLAFVGVQGATNLTLSDQDLVPNSDGSMISGFSKISNNNFWCMLSFSLNSQVNQKIVLPFNATIYTTMDSVTYFDTNLLFGLKRSVVSNGNCIYYETIIYKNYKIVQLNLGTNAVKQKLGKLTNPPGDTFLQTSPALDWYSYPN